VTQAEVDAGDRPGTTTDRARRVVELEIAVAEYLDWYNHRRLHEEIGTIPPVELEHNSCVNLVGA